MADETTPEAPKKQVWTKKIPRPTFVQVSGSGDFEDQAFVAVCTQGRAWMYCSAGVEDSPEINDGGWFEVGGPRYALDADAIDVGG